MSPALIAILASVALFCHSASAADALVRLPVIDRTDIRFTSLAGDGEVLKRWVMGIAQDRRGFIWLATNDGLYRFDGYSLKHYGHDPADPGSLGDDTVRAVYGDREGNVWVGTNSAGLDKLEPGRDKFVHYRHDPHDEGSIGGNKAGCVFEDSGGTLWVGNDGGLDGLDPKHGTFRHDSKNQAGVGDSAVSSIYGDRQGDLWLGSNRGLTKVDRVTGRITRYRHDPRNPRSLTHDEVGAMLEDQAGVLWVASGNVLEALDRKTGEFTHYTFHSEMPGREALAGVTSIIEDKDGALWLGTNSSGLLKLDRERKAFSRYLSDPVNPSRLRDNGVDALFRDAEGNIWAGTKSGVSRFPAKAAGFIRYQRERGKPGGLRDNTIWSVQEDSLGFLWIGTRSGVHRLDRRTGQIRLFAHDAKNRHSISYDTVSAVREDREGTLWFATYGGGLNRFDRATGQFRAYRHESDNPDSLSSDRVLSLLVDRGGGLWAGTGGGGLNRFDPATGKFKSWRGFVSGEGWLDDDIKVIFEDREGMIWTGSNGSLRRFDPRTKRFTTYRNTAEPGSLSGGPVNAIYEDRAGMLWVGTRTGLNRMDRGRGAFEHFTEKDGLPDASVEAILEDARGDLWLATHYGLSHFDPRTRTFRNYTETDGLAGNNMNPYGTEASCATRDGKMVFGSTDGVTLFDPERLAPNRYVPPVALTDFLLFNTPVIPGEQSVLTTAIEAAKSVTLNSKQSIFTFQFTALSYAAPEKNRYRYRLEGLERDWNEVDSRHRQATYTSLPARRYVFRVQASNNEGVWNESGAAIEITVLPPWWAAWWFRLCVALSIAGLAFGAHRYRVGRLERQKALLEGEVSTRTRELRIAKEAAEAANRTKSVFLANMSHELRTPLNAILGFSSLVREDPGLPEERRKDMDIINRSGEHLLGLINEVLDMAKIEAGRKGLEIVSCDLKGLAREVAEMVRMRADQKGITLTVAESDDLPRFVRTDAGKVRQILINLLGNAVKFTEEGTVTLRSGGAAGEAVFEIEDTGVGIAPEDRERIFEAFVQVGRPGSQKGTGLGLSITRQFVELMGGSISVASAPGKGSTFRVAFPVAPAQEAEVREPEGRDHRYRLQPGQPEWRILIVEDERENQLLLQRLLTDAGFSVRVAGDGEHGILVFQAWHPHFIWMDVRMPVMDGREATRRIRALEGGREVKIVAVTASTSESERGEVLAAGLDDFVRKPYRAAEVFECMARQLGVAYVADRGGAVVRAAAPPVSADDVAALPEEIRADLRTAVIALDRERLAAAIRRASEVDPRVGQGLAACAERFAYTSILKALGG
ncbi:MAG TPA: two-component regulator propeller domain-containing protein [Candidatus Acidoferrales bacterium]|nr:two-component regulator propeller domain-containing protein [Candidatus Acidoferrales bacterium]